MTSMSGTCLYSQSMASLTCWLATRSAACVLEQHDNVGT